MSKQPQTCNEVIVFGEYPPNLPKTATVQSVAVPGYGSCADVQWDSPGDLWQWMTTQEAFKIVYHPPYVVFELQRDDEDPDSWIYP